MHKMCGELESGTALFLIQGIKICKIARKSGMILTKILEKFTI